MARLGLCGSQGRAAEGGVGLLEPRAASSARNTFANLAVREPSMFEPENDLERSLVRAADDPAHRPNFLLRMLNAQVVVVLQPDGPQASGSPDGRATTSPQGKMKLPMMRDGHQEYLPIFTALSRAKASSATGSPFSLPCRRASCSSGIPESISCSIPGMSMRRNFYRTMSIACWRDSSAARS